MKTNVSASSIKNHTQNREAGMLQAVEQQIVSAMSRKRDYTRLELSTITGIAINSVAGRVNSLLKKHILVTNEHRRCNISGRVVSTVRLA